MFLSFFIPVIYIGLYFSHHYLDGKMSTWIVFADVVPEILQSKAISIVYSDYRNKF